MIAPRTASVAYSGVQRESKPTWADVPRDLSEQLADLLSAPIVNAEVLWGGFGPSATFLLTTESGQKFFCKGTHPSYTKAGKQAFLRERTLYEELPELSAFAPAFRGAVGDGEWQPLVLDLVPRSLNVPPWIPGEGRHKARRLSHQIRPERVNVGQSTSTRIGKAT
jgi:hypothetical protein